MLLQNSTTITESRAAPGNRSQRPTATPSSGPPAQAMTGTTTG